MGNIWAISWKISEKPKEQTSERQVGGEEERERKGEMEKEIV